MPAAIILWAQADAPMGIAYRIVEPHEDLEQVARSMGHPCTGVTEIGGRLRPELRGQPTFDGLCGPCWGGEETPLRYETWAVHERCSR